MRTCVLNRRPSSAASHVLYEMVTEGRAALAQAKMLRGAAAGAAQAERSLPAAGSASQNSAKALLLPWQSVKGGGCSGFAGGSSANSGKAMKEEPCGKGVGRQPSETAEQLRVEKGSNKTGGIARE